MPRIDHPPSQAAVHCRLWLAEPIVTPFVRVAC